MLLSVVSCLFEDKFSCKLIISRNECDFYKNECTGQKKISSQGFALRMTRFDTAAKVNLAIVFLRNVLLHQFYIKFLKAC